MSLKAIKNRVVAKIFGIRDNADSLSKSESLEENRVDENEVKETKPAAFRDYTEYCARLDPFIATFKQNFEKRLPRLPSKPLISVILPVYNPEIRWLQAAIDSVVDQIYPYWELCIADDASSNPEVKAVLEKYCSENDKIFAVFRAQNGHISKASNSALELASGEFVALLDHDDTIPSHALARVVDCINQYPDSVLIYSDEDKIDHNNVRSEPHFKSDWNPDLLLGQNFISHLGVYKRSVIREIGGFRSGYEGAQDWDLALRTSAMAKPGQIRHIPEVLYHWRTIPGSTAKDIGEKSYAHEAARKAIEDHFLATGVSASLEPVDRYYWRPRYDNQRPKVSIIIPTRDRIELLKDCINSIRSNTNYPDYKIVVANNESEEEASFDYFNTIESIGIEVIETPGPFNFSRINNQVIQSRDEEIVCLLNSDTTIINSEWLEELVMHAIREEIGPVGGKLLYPHDHVQHAGIVLGIGGIGSEAFKFIHKTDDGYIHRAFLIGNYSAVTGACMAFRKSIWTKVGGFNEIETPNAYSDVDFCLRCQIFGYRSIFTPFATLYHAESASRGPDNSIEFATATAFMNERWGPQIKRDPFYNPNLTLEREDFSLAQNPRGYSTL